MLNAIPSGGSRTILLSKRGNIFFIERAKVSVFNERVIYRKEYDEEYLDFNIPDCNTSFLLLGKGTSITDAAARSLAKSGVVVGFCGSGGTPLHSLNDMTFLFPADEYRPTEYCQKWCEKWFIQEEKMKLAIKLQEKRYENLKRYWSKNVFLILNNISLSDDKTIENLNKIKIAKTEQNILLAEAEFTKYLYKILRDGLSVKFYRKQSGKVDNVNDFLDHGNYLMYGCAAVALHALGIPPAFPLVHGKTNRGGLVFDIADLLKDSIVLPLAFEMGTNDKKTNQDFRVELIKLIQKEEIIDQMIAIIKYLLEIENRYY